MEGKGEARRQRVSPRSEDGRFGKPSYDDPACAKGTDKDLGESLLRQRESGGTAQRRFRFEERYRRVTTYVEVELHDQLRALYEQGQIDTYVSAVNAALRAYLRKAGSVDAARQ